MAERFCKVCRGWHSLDEDWPQACHGHFRASAGGSIQIIKDIDPYRTVAADVNGKRANIGSRREHREFLKRNDYIELGNDVPKEARREIRGDFVTGHDVKRAIEEVKARNG